MGNICEDNIASDKDVQCELRQIMANGESDLSSKSSKSVVLSTHAEGLNVHFPHVKETNVNRVDGDSIVQFWKHAGVLLQQCNQNNFLLSKILLRENVALKIKCFRNETGSIDLIIFYMAKSLAV